MVSSQAKLIASNKGITLIELMVTITIALISLSIAALGFNQWQNKSNAEAQIRQMATDINELRVRAMTRKQPSSIVLNQNSYVLKAYTSVFAPYSTNSQQKTLPSGTRAVKFPLVKSSGTAFNNEYFEFDERGVVTSYSATIGSLPVQPFQVFLGGVGTNGSIDCLTIGLIRINVGKTSSGVCNDR